MLWWPQLYYKLLNLLLSKLVRSRSIPIDPTVELGLDTSCPVVYVLLHNSKTDLLTLRTQCLMHNLPDPLEPLIINGIELQRYVFIYNDPYVFTYCTLKEDSIKLFHNYLDLHFSNVNLNIQMIPVSVMFGRHPDRRKVKTNPSLRIIFNGMQKFFAVIWFGRDSFVYFSPFVSLRWMATEYGADKDIAYKLARAARMHFARQRLAIIGPYLPTRQHLFNKLLVSKTVIRAIKDIARSRKISQKQAQKSTIMLMKEIAANLSYEMIRFADRILGFIWSHLYQKINVHNTERIRQLAYNGHEIVYIPCHRSHMDYLLLSYVLYNQGLVPPHIAAGINLNFWPAGPIFRRLGAFFIRRNFKGNKLYSTVFREYLSELFIRGYSVEYFIEGGRSRTGRLLNPKTGTLSMTIQAMLRGSTRPITLVPIYIGYEKVVEVDTYAKEMSGASKEKENLLQAIRSLIKLRNLGQIYINVGEPLSLIHWLNKHVPNWCKFINPIEAVRPYWLIPTVNDIAVDLMVRINNAGAMNAMNLCCTVLLASRQRYLTRKQLTEQLNCYLDLMRNVPYSKDSIIPSVNANILIDYVLQMNEFKLKKNITGDSVIIPCNQVILFYYSNNIIHMLTLPSLVAVIIIQHDYISRQELIYQISILYPMLKAELFLRWDRDELSIELDKIINELLRQELVFLKKNNLHVNLSSFTTLQLLAASSCEILQRYAIVFCLLSSNASINRNSLEKKSQILTNQLSVLHNDNSSGSFDKAIFNTLLSTLRNEGYVNSSGSVELERTTKVYQILAELIASDVRSILDCIK